MIIYNNKKIHYSKIVSKFLRYNYLFSETLEEKKEDKNIDLSKWLLKSRNIDINHEL